MGLKSLFKSRSNKKADTNTITGTSKKSSTCTTNTTEIASGDGEKAGKSSPSIVSSSKVSANEHITTGGDDDDDGDGGAGADGDGGVIIPAASTESTGAYSSMDGSAYSQLQLSQLAHGSNVDISAMSHKGKHGAARANGGDGGLNLSASDGALPDVIATMKKQRPMATHRQQQQQPQKEQTMYVAPGWAGDGETMGQDTRKYQRDTGIGDQLSVIDILQTGLYSVLGCVQCRPLGGPNRSAPPVPGLIDPYANDDRTIGSLTLMTVEREERERSHTTAMYETTTPDRHQTESFAPRMKAIAPQQVVDKYCVEKQQCNEEEDAGKKVKKERAAKEDGNEPDGDCDSMFGTIGGHFVGNPAFKKDGST